jgi:hypothetical protein
LPGDPARDVLLLSLTADGRIVDPAAFDRFERALRADITDCFIFCHGWLYDEGEARREAARFFAVMEGPLAPLRDRVAPLRVAVHWPSKPFGDPLREIAHGLWPSLAQQIATRSPAEATPALLDQLIAAEVPQAPEEQMELDAIRRRIRDARGGAMLSPFQALSFWVMKRRAGVVGERFGREYLTPMWDELPLGRPRLHVIGHSFGAKLVTSAVLGGARPQSLTLLLGAFSAFAFAPAVPGIDRPGFYHRILADEQVRGRIVVLRSRHDTALRVLYPAVTGSGQADRRPHRAEGGGSRRQLEYLYTQEAVAASALGSAGARGVGAPEVELLEAQMTGLPRHPLVNVDGSRVMRAQEPVVGAHRDIHHPEIATLVLLAGGLLEGGPEGARPPRRPLMALA